MFTKTLIAAAFVSSASAHLLFGIGDSAWGGRDSSLELPMNSGTYDWWCHGKDRSTAKGTTELKAGGTLSAPIICGEQINNLTPDGIKACYRDDANAFHGYGGCGIAVSYKSDPKSLDDFYLVSVAHDCPRQDSFTNFKLPSNLPNGAVVGAWFWIPNPNAAADEMYMTCFNAKVTGGSSGHITGGKHPIGWAVPGIGANGERPLYKNKFPDGPQAITVSGGSGSGSHTTYKPPTKTTTKKHTTTYKRPTKTTTQKVITTHVGGKKVIKIIRIVRVVRIVRPKSS
ncbi:hypothetical protein HDV00_005141 [Rhizophlyctis rosea]|nr:hypothetical protein HDV00_005141 [Rhizophlyctis rosea]